MRRWMIAPTLLLLLTSATPPPATPAPFDLTSLLQMCGGGPGPVDDGPTVLLPGYGPGGFPIRTAKPEAQAFFDNGVQLAQAYAHSEAPLAFIQARKIDPSCAMCAWGEAWAKGPTLNYDISASDSAELAGIVAEALKLAEGGPALEIALIEALGKRYGKEGTDDLAFANAMEAIAAAYPDNDAVVTLAADAMMVAARKLHLDNMAPHMTRPVALLETVLKRTPDYAPAIHFYVHATEIGGYPERAEPYAERLATIAPAASHLIHMPSHTFYWIGRYRDAAVANVEAIKVNDARAAKLGKTEPGAAYAMGNYHWHNAIYGLGGALMSGDGEAGLAIAGPLIAAGSARPIPAIILRRRWGTPMSCWRGWAPLRQCWPRPIRARSGPLRACCGTMRGPRPLPGWAMRAASKRR